MKESSRLSNENQTDYANSKIIRFAFEMLNEDAIEDFRIWNHDTRFGIFNNIIIETTKNSHNEVFAFHLKFLPDNEKISMSSLQNIRDEFSVLKYYDNYLQCQNSYPHAEVKYILYCNGALPLDDSQQNEILLSYKREEIPLFIEKVDERLPFVSEAKANNQVYRLRPKSDQFKLNSERTDENDDTMQITNLRKFLDSFYLYTGQETFQEDELLNIKEYNSFFYGNQGGQFNAFTKSVRDNAKEKFTKKFFGLKLLDCLINSGEDTSNNNTKELTIHQKDIQKLVIEAFASFDLTLTTKYDSVIVLRNTILQELPKRQNKYEVSKDKFLWYGDRFILIINASKNNSELHIEKTINLCRNIGIKVILVNDEKFEMDLTQWKTFNNLRDLLLQDYKLYSRITSKCSVHTTHDRVTSLKHFLQDDEELCAQISVNNLLDLVTNVKSSDPVKQFTISPTHCHYFSPSLMWHEKKFTVSLHMIRQVIDVQFISRVSRKTVLVINCRDQVEQFQKELDRFELPSAVEIHLYRRVYTEEMFTNISKQREDVSHHLFNLVKLNDNYRLEWTQSTGSVVDLQDFRLHEHFIGALDLYDCRKKMNIIWVRENVYTVDQVQYYMNTMMDPKCFAIDINKEQCAVIARTYNCNDSAKDWMMFQKDQLSWTKLWNLDLLWEKRRVVIFWKHIPALPGEQLETLLKVIDDNRNFGIEQWIWSTDEDLIRHLEERFCSLAWKFVQSGTPDVNKSHRSSSMPQNGQPGHKWEPIRKDYQDEASAKKLTTTGVVRISTDVTFRSEVNFVQQSGNSDHENLFIALQHGQLGKIEQLVMQGVDVNSIDGNGATPLALAAAAGHFEIVKFLTFYKADINKVDTDGCTPIWLAASNGHVQVVRYLNDKGANPSKRNKEGQSPLDIARSNKHDAVIKYLAVLHTN